MTILYIVSGLVITVLVHLLLYILYQFDRKKVQEKLMIQNATLILNKIDKINKPGGTKMELNLKNIAKFLSKKIDTSKDEIMDELAAINSRLDEFEQSEEVEEDYEEDVDEDVNEGEDSEFDEVFDDVEETEKTPIPKPPKPSIPKALEIKKRQLDNKEFEEEQKEEEEEEKEKKKKKKGFFSKK